MEQKFIAAWLAAREAATQLGIHLRPMVQAQALQTARQCLSGRRASDGFDGLAALDRLDLSLEALVLRPEFGPLFTDPQVNTALSRLLERGYHF